MRIFFKLLLLLGLLTNYVSANIDECKTDLYYANGIMMLDSEKDALQKWKNKANDLLLSKPKSYKKIADIKISYNVSQGFFDDMIESFEQIMDNEWGWNNFTTFFKLYLTTKGIQEDWKEHVHDLNNQVENYKKSIKNGHGVIVLAHSQGNYYTNEAYERLDDWMKKYFHMFGIATPANHVAGYPIGDKTSPYVTFHDDIIQLVITGLPSNRDNPNADPDGKLSVKSHNFYESYLRDKNIKNEILNFIEQKIEKHTQAPSQWKIDKEFNKYTKDYRVTIKHRFDTSSSVLEDVYPFNLSKKLYQVNGEYVKASCGGENITDDWEGQDNKTEFWKIDNPQEEKITTKENNSTVNLNNGLVAHYEFEGNTNDSSGNGNNGTEYGGISYVEGVIGQASSFDGQSKIFVDNFLDRSGQTDMSFSFWIKPDLENDIGGIVTEHSACHNSDDFFHITLYNNHYNKNSLEADIFDSERVKIPSNEINTEWHKVDFIYTDGGYKFYLDGVLKDKIPNPTFRSKNNLDETLRLVIGGFDKDYCSINHDYTGLIDDLRIYNRALSEVEIRELYRLGQTEEIVESNLNGKILEEKDKWRAKIKIDTFILNQKSATIDFRALNCGGELSYLQKKDNGYLFSEKITYGNCVQNCQIWIKSDGSKYKEFCRGELAGVGDLFDTTTDNNEPIPTNLNGKILEEEDKWRAKIKIDTFILNQKSATIDFRALNCGGELSYLQKKDNGYLFSEKITYGNCVQNCQIWLKSDGSQYKEFCRGELAGVGELKEN